MKKIILLRGIPGSGKSTETKRIVADSLDAGLTCEVFSADEFFMQPDGNGGKKYVYQSRFIGNAHDACQWGALGAMERGVDVVIIDNTCVTAYDAGFYVYHALDRDYEIEFVEPSSPQWKAFLEYRSRVKGQIKPEDPIVSKFVALNVHGVPGQSIAKMMRKWQPVITIDEALTEFLK